MNQWEIIIPKRTEKRMDKFPEKIRDLVYLFIEALHETPFPQGFNIEKLRGTRNCFRAKFGDYRIIYCVYKKSKTIIITDAFHRGRGYR